MTSELFSFLNAEKASAPGLFGLEKGDVYLILTKCANVRATFHTVPQIGLESPGVSSRGCVSRSLWGCGREKLICLDHTPLDRSRFL
jgi:hypothetical protein